MTPEEKAKAETAVFAGAEAERILKSEVLWAAFDARELTLVSEIVSSEPENRQQREDAYFELRAIRQIRKKLTNQVDRGKVAADRLGHAEARRDG